jgi:hypothetical protein
MHGGSQMIDNHTKILNEINKIHKNHSVELNAKFIYHFTNGNALKSIIESCELWLHERNYMNDILDEKYIREIISNIISDSNITKEFTRKQIENLFFVNTPQYIFSTSMEGDLINQWIYYGSDNSYCIEFDNNELGKYFEDSRLYEDKIYGGPVIYNENASKKIFFENNKQIQK